MGQIATFCKHLVKGLTHKQTKINNKLSHNCKKMTQPKKKKPIVVKPITKKQKHINRRIAQTSIKKLKLKCYVCNRPAVSFVNRKSLCAEHFVEEKR